METTDYYFEKYSSLCQFEEGSPEYLIDKDDFKTAMIEFAKQHVKAALEAASNSIECYTSETHSILNSYPDTNIK